MAASTLLAAILTLGAICPLCLGFVEAPSFEEQLQALSSRQEQLEADMAALKSQPCACANSSRTIPVAFYAGLSKTLGNLGSHQHIVFDNVITNIGNGYSGTHGFFTAPVRGVYAFFVTITNIPKHSASFQLVKNGKWLGHVLAHGSTANPSLYVTSTLAATTSLEVGDEVWVQNEYSFSTVEELDGSSWSSFTGHIVTEI